ncbi:hypothetical protein [Flavobacterium filum]|uniref:hypothetical protein n=1 Tax=Flavobacterium filum TaxID=370974 RepID=UPI00047C07DB|nr:hypothetical protein [Flavobacterium filum]
MLNPKIAKELPPFPTEKLFFKISFPSKIFKTANPQPTQKQPVNDSETHSRHGLQQLDRQNASW